MKDFVQKVKVKHYITIGGLIIYSLGVWCLLNYSNINSLMADDNLHQWEPVIETVFDRIFSAGELPMYDFYNHKGLDIFSSGYYGQLNPFMYFSYAISKFFFSFDIKVLVIYMMTMYCLGNVVLYLILSELNISNSVKLLSVFSYSSILFFFSYGIYYFTFNSYFFIPFLAYVILKCRGRVFEWFVPGVMLASSMLLGHVQYSCYYVIVYCIIQCVFSVQKKSLKPIINMILCVSLFGILNSMFFVSMLSGAQNRSQSGISTYDFLLDSVSHFTLLKPFELIIHPDQINTREVLFEHIGLGISPFLCLSILVNRNTKKQIHHIYTLFENKVLICDDEEKRNCRKFLLLMVYIALVASIVMFNTILLDDYRGFILMFLGPLLIAIILYIVIIYVDNNTNKGVKLINDKSIKILFYIAFFASLGLMIFSSFTFMIVMIGYYD